MSRVVGAGAWLFRHRTWIPIPLALALLLVPPQTPRSASAFALGVAVVCAGEAIRLWAVRHIGVISRTRSDRLGPLIATGPFARVRNPLYLGNIALWVGFALSAGPLWLTPVFFLVLSLEYHTIVRWEEQLLVSRQGDAYKAYVARVPRWIPSVAGRATRITGPGRATYPWRETLFSERGTLIAIAVGLLLLLVKK
jgi:protein-S-isoprenylcysteine O-methyltransferase Ste14